MPPYSSSNRIPKISLLAVELDDVPRELGALVDLRGARRDALAREVAHEVADLALLVGQRVDRHDGKSTRGITDAGSARRRIRGGVASRHAPMKRKEHR